MLAQLGGICRHRRDATRSPSPHPCARPPPTCPSASRTPSLPSPRLPRLSTYPDRSPPGTSPASERACRRNISGRIRDRSPHTHMITHTRAHARTHTHGVMRRQTAAGPLQLSLQLANDNELTSAIRCRLVPCTSSSWRLGWHIRGHTAVIRWHYADKVAYLEQLALELADVLHGPHPQEVLSREVEAGLPTPEQREASQRDCARSSERSRSGPC